ncbi:MAG: hypothetical protein ACOVSW_10845 [Candidatus Kapaibacteriota bacterium]
MSIVQKVKQSSDGQTMSYRLAYIFLRKVRTLVADGGITFS